MSIEIRSVTRTFGSFRALDDVSLTVGTGRLVALLGPSGSGKTTLLRIIAGLDAPDDDRGVIRFHDEDVGRTHASRRGVGFVFQHYALFRHMTVFENVAFGLRVMPRRRRPGGREVRERVHGLLTLVQLDQLAARYPHQLSGGQRQRVALARALAVQPRVLLLDEPFGALDARVRKELRAWLRRLHEEIGVTSVLVTHDQDEALEVADDIVVMNQGQIEQAGTPDDVFHNPQTEFVMRFLGEVNAFHGRVEGGRVHAGPMTVPWPEERRTRCGSARVFVRPHDFTIDTRCEKPGESIPAEVVRVHSAGAGVRLELRIGGDQRLVAEVSQERFSGMALAAGSTCYVRPRHIRVFADGREAGDVSAPASG